MNEELSVAKSRAIRRTQQYELPLSCHTAPEEYDVYPVHSIGEGKIFQGYDALADSLRTFPVIRIEGYVGILFKDVKERLAAAFAINGVHADWIDVGSAMHSPEKITSLTEPYLGGDDPVFGRICPHELIDFFDYAKLMSLVKRYEHVSVGNDADEYHSSETPAKEDHRTVSIYYGIGASLVPVDGPLIYFDIAKNEIQFRSRAGVICNLGATGPDDPRKMYKQFYFVDWVVLNRHFHAIAQDISFFVDGQRSAGITWMHGDDWRYAINRLAARPFRPRPWFEPGVWGGSWIKDNIGNLPKDVVNYAWSFELIYPENGLVLESSSLLLETTFESLMCLENRKLMGVDAFRYDTMFPIRFDFLDTFDGGNLSVQCHPTLEYIRRHFGELITQEETYYILDCQAGSKVYLGFQQGVTRDEFRTALEASHAQNKPLAVDGYVQSFESKKHDLFLIPPGTIHASGKGTLVLEISSTPYIYTFKMYDWLRLDLDGKARPLNITRGMDNLVFERQGDAVLEELISRPALLRETPAYSWWHLPTHAGHLYDVYRYHVTTQVEVETNDKVSVLNLVEGKQVEIIVNDETFRYHYAETFIVPAAVGRFVIRNPTQDLIKIVRAFVK